MEDMTFKSRVYTVEAVRLTDDNAKEVASWVGDRLEVKRGPRFQLRSGSGLEEVREGDWLVRFGEDRPIVRMSDAKFNALYEPTWRHE